MNKYINIIVSMLFLSFVGIVACENSLSDTDTQTLTVEDKSKAFIADLSQSATSEISYDKIALEDTEIANKAHQYLSDVGFTDEELSQILFDKQSNRSLKEVDAAVTWLALIVAVSEVPELQVSANMEKVKNGADIQELDFFTIGNCLFEATGVKVAIQLFQQKNLASIGGKKLLIKTFGKTIAKYLGPIGTAFAIYDFAACVNRNIADTAN
jgi:hypothetical protein